MELQNLSKAFQGKTFDDLKPSASDKAKNKVLEPTQAEIESMISKFREGKTIKDVRKEVRRAGTGAEAGASFGFSPEQIKAVHKAWVAKVIELKPVEDDE